MTATNSWVSTGLHGNGSPEEASALMGGRHSSVPLRNSLDTSNGSASAFMPIEPIDGIPSFYPQSLWEEARQGKVDHDRLTTKNTYRLPAHKRLVAGKYVEDPDLKDFSNPRYRAPSRAGSRSRSRLSRLGEFLGISTRPTLAASPPPGAGRTGGGGASQEQPQPVYAVPIGQGHTLTPTPTPAARCDTSTSFSTATTFDGENGDEDASSEECDESDAIGRPERHLPPIKGQSPQQPPSPPESSGVGAGRNAVRAAVIAAATATGASASPSANGGSGNRLASARNGGPRAAGNTVKQTFPVVLPIYPFSTASFFFPIHYGRLSAYEKTDPRGPPQRINEEFHPGERADVPLSSVSVQKDNLNRMGLYKIGPGAVAFKVVICAFEAAGMKYTTSNSKFNILWAKRATPYTLASLNAYQKVNHFPGTWGIGRKDSLAQNTSKMKRYFGEAAYDIVPTSFLLPRQEYELKADAERNPGTPRKPLIYILKPTASSCGRGIELCRGVPPMPRGGKQMVCQRYVCNPLLLFGRKFDLRLYCVVTSFDPLRVYLFDEGLVRFAAEKYPGADQALDNVHMHLTNYSVNKTAELTRQSSGKEYDSDDPLDIKWCISDFKRHLALHHLLGLEAWTRIQRECDDVVIKALLSIENDVVERVRHECRDRTGRNCFELFGLDLMVDEDLKVYLIEANIMPSLATASNLDKAVKARMLAHMLTLVRAIPYRRNALPRHDRGRSLSHPRQPQNEQEAAQPQGQQRSRSTRSSSGVSRGEVRSASTASRRSTRGSARRERASHTNEEEEGEESHAREANEQHDGDGDGDDDDAQPSRRGRHESTPGSVTLLPKETFTPHGAEADRPERTYRFGKHPMASARIIDHDLLTAFNDPNDPESMLTPYETLMLVEAEEELRCAGGFRKVFPVSHTLTNYLPLFTHGLRRNNFVLCSAVMMKEARKPKRD